MTHSLEPALPVEAEPAVARPNRWLWWLQPKVALPLTFFILLVLSPFLYRAYRIAEVPDIDEPFDLKAFGSVEIAPAENAMTHYALAVKMLRHPTHSSFGDELDKFRTDGWPAASADLRKWLEDNQHALVEWRKGTSLTQSVEVPPKDLSWNILFPVTQQCRHLTELARLQAERCQHDGDPKQAWDWLHGGLRCSRHVEQHGSLIHRYVGSALQALIAEGVVRWSAHPDVPVELLREAIADVSSADENDATCFGQPESGVLDVVQPTPCRGRVVGSGDDGRPGRGTSDAVSAVVAGRAGTFATCHAACVSKCSGGDRQAAA
jgi:hypothetical protein